MDRRRLTHRAVHCVLLLVLGPVTAVVLTSAPAGAAGLDLHRGSRGAAVQLLETRLVRVAALPRSAVDRRYRLATVNAVKRFQRAHGLSVTGRTGTTTWNAVAAAYRRLTAPPPPAPPAWQAPAWDAPQVTAHRGGAMEAPENTLAGMRHGVARGADVVEMDLRTTSDGVLVLMHDRELSRTTTCSGPVDGRTLAQLAGCRTRSGGQPVPTFAEVAAYVATTGVAMSPELKDQGAALTTAELASFVDTVHQHGLTARTFVQSFDPRVFPRVAALDADLPLVYLSTSVLYVSAVRAAGADIASVRMDALARANVETYHRYGVPIWTWTARSTTDLQRAWTLGVDSVGTDVPTTAVALYR